MPAPKRFARVLIANRGEIAVRVARTLREMRIETVAVYSDADRTALHVQACDRAFRLGPAPAVESYLRGDRILAAALAARADAIHPGYGFLSENAAFAAAVTEAGLAFIGPPPAAMRVMSTKTGARQRVTAAGVPVVPGSDGPLASMEAAAETARRLGYPVLLKAAAGGGGKGMRFVHEEGELAAAWRAARSEAQAAFGDETLYLEKALVRPKHIEVQIFADQRGNAVWLGERECSLQRRHQKIVEEAPAPALSEEIRGALGELAVRIAASAGYVGAGTCEFLLEPASGRYYFLEMNTRLQVEHPVTELCTGLDLVEAQVRVAQGEPLPWRQEDVPRRGHAIEARLYAEDPARDFLPSPGRIAHLVLPHGPGIRVDAGVEGGSEVSRFYDPMIAKIAAWAPERDRARRRLDRALAETVVQGLTSNTTFLRELLAAEAFVAGTHHTATVEELLAAGRPPPSSELVDMALVALAVERARRQSEPRDGEAPPGGGGESSTSRWASRRWRRGE